MAKRHFVYQGKVHGQETVVYYVENEETGKKQFYVLESVPEEYQRSQKGLERVDKVIKEYNQAENKNASLVSRTDSIGRKQWYVREPSSMIPALLTAMKVENEIKKEQKIIDEINKKIELREVKSGVISYKKPSKMKTMVTRAVAAGLTVLILVGGTGALVRAVRGSDVEGKTPESGYTETYRPEATTGNNGESTATPPSTMAPVAPEAPQEKPYIDYDLLTYDTYQNSAGVTMIEVDDALFIANACYNNIVKELDEYNEKSPDEYDYSFDTEKFNPSMFTGEQIRESSLKEYVPKGGDIKKSPDYEDDCRGSFKIGPAAIKEANEVSRNLTGEDVIRSEEDLYDVVRATRACMYIAIKNYEYCAGVISAEAVTPNMVLDTYLYGCGNVRSWLRKCLEDGEYNGKYNPKDYSIDILYYADCLEDYWEKLMEGITDGSHDKSWQDLHVNGLWKLEEYKANLKGTEPGE